MVNVTIYSNTMDPMGYQKWVHIICLIGGLLDIPPTQHLPVRSHRLWVASSFMTASEKSRRTPMNRPKLKKCVQLGSTRYSNAEDLNKVYSLESINSTLKRNNHDFLSNDNLETIEKNTPMWRLGPALRRDIMIFHENTAALSSSSTHLENSGDANLESSQLHWNHWIFSIQLCEHKVVICWFENHVNSVAAVLSVDVSGHGGTWWHGGTWYPAQRPWRATCREIIRVVKRNRCDEDIPG